ncbi:MAG: diguanylate cyclase [Clostridium sp.]
MFNGKQSKELQINVVISIVKLASLLFTVMIGTKFFLTGNMAGEKEIQYNLGFMYILVPLMGFVFVYSLWTFSNKKEAVIRRNKKVINIENALFIAIFTTIIMLSNSYESEYKFIFLFIIIAATIELGMKSGMIIAIVSSGILLLIDLIKAPYKYVNTYFENDLILSGVFILTAWTLGFYVKIEGQHIKMLESMVNIDSLTDVYNHRYFHVALKENITISKKTKKPVALLFLDIDYFKHYNDLYGHQEGDEVLRKLGVILKECVGDIGVVARYGGEEFAVILPSAGESRALEVAENIRKTIETTYFNGQENQPNGNLTASIGVSVYPTKAETDVELIKSADDALYRAKFFKKNRVESYISILEEIRGNIDDKHIEILTSIKTLISVINAKDRYTFGHTERVVIYSRLIADKLKLSHDDKNTLIYGAYMHDIGKISIPKEVLIKKMPLSDEEWEMLKGHPESGVEIIKGVEALNNVNPLILHHHERYDGSGYPSSLKGEDIPYLARILTVVDSFDAMTSNRPYNKCKSFEEAMEELTLCSGKQFDPNIVEAFNEVLKEYKDDFHKY